MCLFVEYKKYKKTLESYLLDRCVNQIKFSLQIFWLLNSYTEDDTLDINKDGVIEYQEYIQGLCDKNSLLNKFNASFIIFVFDSIDIK